MNLLIQRHSGTTPEMARNAFSANQGTNEDDSQSDPHPEAGIFGNQTMRNSGQEDRRDLVTGVQRESFCGRDMVTGATKQIGNRHDMTGVPEEVTYCSPCTSSGKRKRTVLPVNRNSTARTPLRRARQAKFCWPSNSWQMTTILQTFIITSTEFPNCQSHLPQRCPHLTGNLRNLICLKIYSKRASKYILSLLRMTESITSILS